MGLVDHWVTGVNLGKNNILLTHMCIYFNKCVQVSRQVHVPFHEPALTKSIVFCQTEVNVYHDVDWFVKKILVRPYNYGNRPFLDNPSLHRFYRVMRNEEAVLTPDSTNTAKYPVQPSKRDLATCNDVNDVPHSTVFCLTETTL
ncbi:hypothetical protein JTB14_032453 [Gonioctena quinquepunctata]|nr:hypothetical protein JTB14_032453 [Gonioctena quinquepunctata]